jgi:multidrug resistance efflux pump
MRSMKTIPLLAITLGTLAGLGGHLLFRNEINAQQVRKQPPATVGVTQVAANGIVEGARPETAMRSEVIGSIAAIYARENQEVRKGDVLVELENGLQKEQVAKAKAEVDIAKAELDRLRNGERAEKRQALRAVEISKKVSFQQAESELLRSTRLGRATSTEAVEAAQFKVQQTKADWECATAERALIEAPAREDEVAAAEGRVASAVARWHIAQAELAKTRLLAPVDGRILQTFAEPGEMAGPTSAQPILIMADLSKRRVRAFVEELDIAKVEPGQQAVVTVDGFPDREFRGKVGLVLSRMGKRAPQSDAPGEYKDVYYREVLIDLDSAMELPTNLLVRVRIATKVPSETEQ